MNTEKETILVTGSSGQLGSAIVKLLRKRNYKVIGIDILAGNSTDEILDIRNYELLKKEPLLLMLLFILLLCTVNIITVIPLGKGLSKPILQARITF
ncbi:GDP-D-mannose dehydratase [Mesonia maritima]|uniref:GDP-D-mannose dehydratase n=2 Tax=Mesonia maritima TaxID=1793873 RepID=A0ABU1K5U0_9FLAO|nr:GDP-D-mannose dehydratase [Mesonia maritima]